MQNIECVHVVSPDIFSYNRLLNSVDSIDYIRTRLHAGILQCSIKKGLLFLQSIIGHQIYLKHITLMFLKDRTCMVYEKRLNRIFKQK